ncbi:hypothetical protein QYE76_025873 [Lolium multiflorum]|uniref:WRC domain-containing protein n=1 Tax=Lolium multiflorum TaxID=4521 RepID=A0AAD8RGJ1_LOLMU|nr:hypothetical protein QYE76_025873 [Lolium multiflorum]
MWRPQAQALILFSDDPPTAPQPLPPTEAQVEGEVDEEKLGELRCPNPNMDLVVEPSWLALALPLQPQGGNVMARSSENSPDGGGAQRQGAVDAHGSLENAESDRSGWLVSDAGEDAINGVMPAVPLEPTASLNMNEGIKSDGPKKRRGPLVRLEGSGCSRKNGRGWRCSKPTMYGYSLCPHHVSKACQPRGAPKLGRTEHINTSKSVSPSALVMVEEPPSGAMESAANITEESSGDRSY